MIPGPVLSRLQALKLSAVAHCPCLFVILDKSEAYVYRTLYFTYSDQLEIKIMTFGSQTNLSLIHDSY